ncbi:hypothetical protein KC219_26620, partial [Mycobacterium tuberculosis]|nr:hypothetical protein [Mycobacterium tuberculosis]
RWRSSLAALTLVVVIMLVFLSFGYPALAFTLLAAVIGLFALLPYVEVAAFYLFTCGARMPPLLHLSTSMAATPAAERGHFE